jgi:hypothetical protein
MKKSLMFSALFFWLAGCTQQNPGYQQGKEGSPCYPNGTCNGGLLCVDGLCQPDGLVRYDGSAGDGWAGDARVGDGPAVVLDGGSPFDGAPHDTIIVPYPDTTPPPRDVAADAPETCGSLRYRNAQVRRNTQGNWAIAMESKAAYKALSIVGATSAEAAAAIDYDEAGVQVAGFVVSRMASSRDLAAVHTAMINDLKSGLATGTLTVRETSKAVTTVDGASAVTSTLSLHLPSLSEISFQRNTLLAAALKKSSISGWPKTGWGSSSSNMVVRVTSLLRTSGRLVVLGALSDAAADGDAATSTGIVAADMASCEHITTQTANLKSQCEQQTASQGRSAVDIIWVVDESGSMQTQRDIVAQNAVKFFQQAVQNGLDFRMGVTNVCAPNKADCKQGRFCSTATTDIHHAGGTDRFLLPSERSIFEACVRNPPGYESGQEYGLLNAAEAIKTHLPRAINDPEKIRLGAQLVIITVTDEIPNELTSEISDRKACTLSSSAQAKVDAGIKPYLDVFSGSLIAEAKVDFYQVIGGLCGSLCQSSSGSREPDVAHGYKELAAQLNGKVYDVCQADLAAAINTIINEIKIAGVNITVSGRPLPVSMQVAVNGKPLARSRQSGFDYLSHSGKLLFFNTSLDKGDQVTIAYLNW